MPNIKIPLLSLGARGSLGKAVTFIKRRGRNIAEKKPEILDVKSPAQLSWRHMYQKCAALWHDLSAAEKREWEALGTARHMTGFAYWQSQCLRPNPGIYLPLQGGTMQGAIDMDKNRLLKLPLPTDSQEAASKNYVDVAISNLAWAKFLNDTPSGIGAYFEMSPTPTGEVKSTFTSGVLGTGDDQALFGWISDEAASFATILAGVLRVHIHAERTAGNKSIQLYAEIYEYTDAAAEILIATTELCDFLTDDESCIEIHAPLAADYDIAATSKLLIKFLANVGAAGANVTLNLYAEGQTTSSVSLPTPTSPLINAEIAAHAAIAAAHHAAFVLADHTAIGDAAPHHARYADAEAKLIKLDDFATPDDNTDLNASTSRHGLLKKLDNVPTNFMNGQGNWAEPPGADGATKEFFATAQVSGVPPTQGHRGVIINEPDEEAFVRFLVPQDFTSLTSVEAIVRPRATEASMHYTIITYWGAYNGGESSETHTETHVAENMGATTDTENAAIDISSFLDVAAMVAGDLVSVRIAYNDTVVDTDFIFRGVRFKYT